MPSARTWGAYDDLLPNRGRQVVVGTATACSGPYDLVLADLAHGLGDPAAAAEHARDALAQALAVGSVWQVNEATGRVAELRSA